MEGIVTPIIEDFLIKQRDLRRAERGTKKTYFYASDGLVENIDSSKCMRLLTYEFSDEEPEPLTVETLKIFGIGEALHDWIQGILIRTQKAKVIEDFTMSYTPKGTKRIRDKNNKVIIKDPEIHGRMDALLVDDVVVEIKTVSDSSFSYLGNSPRAGHYLQLQLYMHSKKVDKGVLFYINKESGKTKEFIIRYNEEYTKKALKRYSILKKNFIDQGILPPRPYPMHDWHCNFCSYFKTCWKKELEGNKDG